jgi:hypothetical protein
VLPKETDWTFAKLLPEIVSQFPPVVLALVELRLVTVGGVARYVYWSAGVADDEPAMVVTMTSTVPAA